jgi:hypothetical protein
VSDRKKDSRKVRLTEGLTPILPGKVQEEPPKREPKANTSKPDKK